MYYLTCFPDQSSFRQVSSSDCVSPGYCSTLTFECTVTGGSGTVWRGTAFSCGNSNDEIVLLHGRFVNGTLGTCNKGTIVGQDIRVENDTYYTSQLSVLVTSDIIGKSIECVLESYNNASTTVVVIGSFTTPPITGNNTVRYFHKDVLGHLINNSYSPTGINHDSCV